MRKFHIDQRAPSKVYAQWDPTPEHHGKYTRHAEHQRKGEKIPLFPKKIYIWISKKFHSAPSPLSNDSIAQLGNLPNAQRLASLLPAQDVIKDDSRNKDGRKQICQKTKCQRHRKSAHRTRPEDE